MRNERKPLAFSTTLRNPNRIAGFLNCIAQYDGQILTNEIIEKIIIDLIKNRIYKPSRLSNIEKERFNNDDVQLEDKEILNIIKNNPQDHKEKGFDKGWPSRFQTMYHLPMEFGFVKYSVGAPIEMSETGKMLIAAYNSEKIDEQKISNVMLNSMVKYHTNNPFRRNLNKNVPLILLLKVLKKLKTDQSENGAGLYRQELPLLICWPNNDENELYKKIKLLRKNQGFSYSDEYIYSICMALLGADDSKKKRFKMSQICGESVDEYIRKMRSTGIISLRGNGRFIDINSFESNKIDYILSKYSDVKQFETTDEYYDYVSSIDNKIIDTKNTNISFDEKEEVRNKKLKEIANQYEIESIYKELKLLCGKRESKDNLLKYISAPIRLELLISILLVKNYQNTNVKPNYSIDDEGLPTCTAGGNRPDIECYDDYSDSLFEVTLMNGKHDQIFHEILSINSHVTEHKEIRENTFAVFIAPFVHKETVKAAQWIKEQDNNDIITYSVEEFIECVKKTSYPIELQSVQNNGDNEAKHGE